MRERDERKITLLIPHSRKRRYNVSKKKTEIGKIEKKICNKKQQIYTQIPTTYRGKEKEGRREGAERDRGRERRMRHMPQQCKHVAVSAAHDEGSM